MLRILIASLLLLGLAGAPAEHTIAGDVDGSDGEAAGNDSVVLDTAYRFDAEGLLTLSDAGALPVPRGSVTAHWYVLDGWAVVVFEDLDVTSSGPVCLGISAIDPTTHLIVQATYAPTRTGACDDAGAGTLPLADAQTGIRECRDVVAFATRIPGEVGGPLIANIISFAGDGTAVGLSGRLEAPGPLTPLDRSFMDCGRLPPPRVPPPPTPQPTPPATAAPPSRGTTPRSARAPAPSIRPVATCLEPTPGELQDVLSTPAGPYLLMQPSDPRAATATIVFLPGGGGRFGAAQRVWQTIFSGGAGFEAFRVAIPYSVDGDLMGEAMRTFAIVDELLSCHGGDPMRVHLGGTSNGGLAAFGLMTRAPERFATLVGAPGAFPVQDPSSVDAAVWQELLAGRAVLNGVGAVDRDWKDEVAATHNALAAAGIESTYVEFPAQGHVPGPRFDSSTLLEFWASHE